MPRKFLPLSDAELELCRDACKADTLFASHHGRLVATVEDRGATIEALQTEIEALKNERNRIRLDLINLVQRVTRGDGPPESMSWLAEQFWAALSPLRGGGWIPASVVPERSRYSNLTSSIKLVTIENEAGERAVDTGNYLMEEKTWVLTINQRPPERLGCRIVSQMDFPDPDTAEYPEEQA